MDRDDPLLEALLAEVLGGHTPPDLTARILQAWAARGHDPARLDPRLRQALEGAPLPPPLASESAWQPAAPPVYGAVPGQMSGYESDPQDEAIVGALTPAVVPHVSVRSRHARRKSTSWLGPAVAACLLVACSLGIYVATRQGEPRGNSVATHPDSGEGSVSRDAGDGSRAAHANQQETDGGSHSPSHAPTPDKLPRSGGLNNTDLTQKHTSPAEQIVPLPPSAWNNLPASTDEDVVAFVNAQLKAEWQKLRLEPAPKAADDAWCRRAFARLLGRAPSDSELAAFAADKSPDKRAALVQRLLHNEKFAADFNRHWSALWASALMGAYDANDKAQAARFADLQTFLEKALAQHKTFDSVAREILAASDGPAASYWLAVNAAHGHGNQRAQKAVALTTHTARVFVGKQLQCAECHDDASHDATQQQFWSLNGFFRQLHIERDAASGGDKIVNRDFPGEAGEIEEASVFYEAADGRVKATFPAFLDGTAISRSGELALSDRRAALAKMVVASDDFSRATVNRTWAFLMGYGFTRPVDDLGNHNPPSHPAVLERLAQEFKSHGYDMRSLIAWSALAEPFQLSGTNAAQNVSDMPQQGTPAQFSYYYPRPLPGEPVPAALAAAAQIASRGGSLAEKELARKVWLGQAAKAHRARNKELEAAPADELIQATVSMEHEDLIRRIAASKLKPAAKVDHLFLAALGRGPSPRERELANQLIAGQRDDPASALTDIWWALIHSDEALIDK